MIPPVPGSEPLARGPLRVSRTPRGALPVEREDGGDADVRLGRAERADDRRDDAARGRARLEQPGMDATVKRTWFSALFEGLSLGTIPPHIG